MAGLVPAMTSSRDDGIHLGSRALLPFELLAQDLEAEPLVFGPR